MDFSMATLSETAYYSRNFIKYGLSILVGLVIFRGLFIMSIRIYRQLNPPPPPPPTVKYKVLPRPPLVSAPSLPETFNFYLETPDGTTRLENLKNERVLPDQLKVFYIVRSGPDLLGLERLKERAAIMGFSSDPESVGESKYRFRKGNSSLVLDIDSVSQTFKLYQDALIQIPPSTPKSNQEALGALKSGLPRNLYPTDIAEDKTKYRYFRVDGSGLSEVTSLADAEYVRVDLFRASLEDLPIYTSTYDDGQIWGIVSGGSSGGGILELNYKYYPIDIEQFSTYPIISSLDAWNKLGSGGGTVVKLGDNPNGDITIRRIYLGYFDSTETYQKFIQPIYVFEGDNDFVAYVPAITDEWLE
jgi:hypothetical protein